MPHTPPCPALITWQDGQPFSPLYGDRYHTLSGARAQAEHVFLGGCGLPRAWLSDGQAEQASLPSCQTAGHPAQADFPPTHAHLPAPENPEPASPAQHPSGRWTILETGFGLGLNFLSTWASWLANRPDPVPAAAGHDTRAIRHLRFVSTEAHPASADDIRQAAVDDPVLQPLAAQLARYWADASLQAPVLHFCFPPPACPTTSIATTTPPATATIPSGENVHRTAATGSATPSLTPTGTSPATLATTSIPGAADVPDDGTVELIILLGDTTRVLDAWLQQHGPLHADSVFLDGFDPRKNPAMWQASTLQALARHCRPGTRLATWCVARSVRDALAASGFVCEKRPGLPPKRHCLGACLQG